MSRPTDFAIGALKRLLFLNESLDRKMFALSCGCGNLTIGQGNGVEWEIVDTLTADPDYVRTTGDDPLQWDLYLNSGSPMFDAGDPDLVDWYDSSRSDVGAFGGEFGAWRP